MYLKKLSLINFKNIREENLEFRPGINCFVGDNGAGKTNVIDAVYFLSMCKSSLAMTDGQSMRHGSDFFLLDGQYLTDGGRSESVVCAFARKGGKTLKRNGKEYERLSDHVGLIPVVIVSPGRHDAHQRRRRRTPPLPERFYLPVGPCLSAGSGTLQRRIGRTQPPAQNLAGRTDALHIRPSAGRTGRHHPPQTQRNRSSARTRSRPILPPPLQRPRTGDARIPLGG